MGFSNFLKLSENPEVYPPQEDTLFLTDILEREFQKEVLANSNSFLVCEVGVGTGFISIVLGKKYPQIHFIGVDISSQATKICYKNMSEWLQRTQFDVLCMDLLCGFNPSRFFPSIVFFNPPYLRTTQEEMMKEPLPRTWAGGPTGIMVIQEFLKTLTKIRFGKAYFLSSIYNTNELFSVQFQEFYIQVIAEKKIEDDKLICYEVQYKRKPK
ncbi:MAG: methyltransferase [Candidatus Heimdallarchaeota archaeon]|nr:MAG: methyltransferase [Candidatus Heimdallarchaeota archaeon]